MSAALNLLGLDPNTPSTGVRLGRTHSQANSEVAVKLARFQSLYLAYPPHLELHSRFDFVRQLGQLTLGKPQKGLRVLAPSGSGKTSSVLAYIHRLEQKLPPTEFFRPALYVALERDTTPKKLMIAILQAFGDAFATRGTEVVLKQRAWRYFHEFDVQILFVDEVQHLRPGNSHTTNDATDALKRILDEGLVPVVFLGTDEAEDLFTRNVQLSSRLHPPADLPRLVRTNPEDRGLLKVFLDHLDDELVAHGLQAKKGILSHAWIRACLHQVCDGVIGRVMRLISVALEVASRREADFIEAYDLAEATDRWALPQGLVTRNPFRTSGAAQ